MYRIVLKSRTHVFVKIFTQIDTANIFLLTRNYSFFIASMQLDE